MMIEEFGVPRDSVDPTVEDVYEKFKELIESQKSVISALDVELKNLNNDIDQAYQLIKNTCISLINSARPEHVRSAALALDKAYGGFEFEAAYTVMMRDNEDTERKIDIYSEENGSDHELQQKAILAVSELSDADKKVEDLYKQKGRLEAKMVAVFAHNEAYPNSKIESENKAAFERNPLMSSFKYMSDSSYRNAISVLSAYQGDYYKDEQALADLQKELNKAEAAQKVAFQESSKANDQSEAMQNLKDSIKAPTDIQATLQDQAISVALKDDDFIDGLKEVLSERKHRNLLSAALQYKNLTKIRDNIQRQKDATNNVLKSLTDPIDDLESAAWRSPYHELEDLNLSEIEQQVKVGQAIASYRVSSAVKARQGIMRYTHDDTASLASSHNLLLIWMVANTAVDPAYAHDSIGLDDQTISGLKEQGIDIDLNHLSPSISDTLGALNISGIDIQNTFSNVASLSDISSSSFSALSTINTALSSAVTSGSLGSVTTSVSVSCDPGGVC